MFLVTLCQVLDHIIASGLRGWDSWTLITLITFVDDWQDCKGLSYSFYRGKFEMMKLNPTLKNNLKHFVAFSSLNHMTWFVKVLIILKRIGEFQQLLKSNFSKSSCWLLESLNKPLSVVWISEFKTYHCSCASPNCCEPPTSRVTARYFKILPYSDVYPHKSAPKDPHKKEAPIMYKKLLKYYVSLKFRQGPF